MAAVKTVEGELLDRYLSNSNPNLCVKTHGTSNEVDCPFHFLFVG